MAVRERLGRERATWEERGGRVRIDGEGAAGLHHPARNHGKRYGSQPGLTPSPQPSPRRSGSSATPRPTAGRPRGRGSRLPRQDPPQAFLKWSLKVRGNSAAWVAKQDTYLSWWAKRLVGVNLRGLDPRDYIIPAVAKAKSRRARLAVLKALLRLPPQGTAPPQVGQTTRPSTSRSRRRSPLNGRNRRSSPGSTSTWCSGTSPPRGATRLPSRPAPAGTPPRFVRFAAEGTIDPAPQHLAQEGVAGVVVCPLRKSGEMQLTRVGPISLEAASSSAPTAPSPASGTTGPCALRCKAVKRPDGEVGIDNLHPRAPSPLCRELGHRGRCRPGERGRVPGHRSPRTTMKFYAVHSAPKKVPTLLWTEVSARL